MSVLSGPAPAVRLEQDALDHLRVNIVRFEIFDGGDGIAAFLDRDAVIDNVAPAIILPLVMRSGNHQAAVLLSLSIHVLS